jgi:hypothetical protein
MGITRSLRAAVVGALLGTLGALPAHPGVQLDVDKTTLNRILSAVAVREVQVPIAGGRTLAVQLRDLEVTALEPANGESGNGHIRTALRVVSPEIGLDVAVAPRISLNVVDEGRLSVLELRFEEVAVGIPVLGQVNIARLVPPMRYPADNIWLLAGAEGDVEVVSRLRRIEMDRRAVRFEFDIEIPGAP